MSVCRYFTVSIVKKKKSMKGWRKDLWYKTQKNGYWVTRIPVVIAMGMMVLQSQRTNNRNAVNRGCDILLNLACRCLYKLPDNVNVSLASSGKCSVLWFLFFFMLGTADCWKLLHLLKHTSASEPALSEKCILHWLPHAYKWYLNYILIELSYFDGLYIKIYVFEYKKSSRNPFCKAIVLMDAGFF